MTKTVIVPGELYQWLPDLMKGRDGNIYEVFTMFASGRGWASKKFYTRKNPKHSLIPVVRALHTNRYQPHQKHVYGVDIVEGHDLEILAFNKSPYVRKDGTFRVTVDEGAALRLPQFGLLGGVYAVQRTELYMWDTSKGASLVDQFYEKDVSSGILVRDQLHYLTNILHSNGNLVKV